MSQENAHQFLSDAAQDQKLREQFDQVANPQEFIQKCHELGYEFTAEELESVVQAHSEDVATRRKTGVWTWLRQVNWISRV